MSMVLDTDFNVKRKLGLDEHSTGWNTSVFAFLINVGVVLIYTVVEKFILPKMMELKPPARVEGLRPLFIGKKVDKMFSNPFPWVIMLFTLVAACPIWYDPGSNAKFTGNMAAWGSTSSCAPFCSPCR